MLSRFIIEVEGLRHHTAPHITTLAQSRNMKPFNVFVVHDFISDLVVWSNNMVFSTMNKKKQIQLICLAFDIKTELIF